MGFDAADRSDAAALRAVLKCDVVLRCARAGGFKPAPKGDYLVSRVDDGVLSFAPADGGDAYRLSLDATLQHVVEGRLLMSGVVPGARG